MIIDGLIVLFIISALFRGLEIGFIRQFGSTVGFFSGLFLGAYLQRYTLQFANTPLSRAMVTIVTVLGMAFLFLAIGEFITARAKLSIQFNKINKVDNFFGAFLSIASLLLSAWLVAAIVNSLPFPGIQASVRSSRILNALEQRLPPAPTVVSNLSRLIDPNGFPNVFIGTEPLPSPRINLPSGSEFQPAVQKVKTSVVKIEGQGCGGIVEGTGFVVRDGLVATNAHVIAGIKRPYVMDANGTHTAVPVWFDPNLDFAVLRVSNLAGGPLTINVRTIPDNTPAAVLGYPGGGAFTAGPAAILNHFTASGRDIYGRGTTNREIYELQADIIPGNSGGPVIDKQGQVVAVVFAQSTQYKQVGYALMPGPVINAINQAAARNAPVGTGSCAE